MTGATTLTADPTIISNKTGVTPVGGDYLLLWDATDSLLKKADASNFLAGAVSSVNGETGTVVLVSDDISDTTSTNKWNITHTGDVTGATTLGIVPAAISGKTGVSPASGDYVLLWDATDSLLKKADVSAFLSGGGSGGGDVTGPASSTDLALAIYDGTSGKLLKNSAVIVDTSSNLVNGTGGLHITTAARYLAQTALSTSGAVSWNLRSAPSAKIILSGDVTDLTISEISLNSEATLYVKQDATTPYSITWDSEIKWAGGYTPDISELNSINVFSFFSYDGTGLIGTHVSDTFQTTGIYNFLDTTSDSYFFGSDATSNQHVWSTGLSVIQLGEDLSISNNKALSNTGANIMLGGYLDSTGSYRYTSTDDSQRINLNASTNQMDFYHCDSSSHIEGDYINYKRRVAIAPAGLYVYNDSNTQVFGVDITGNIITSGLVDGRDIATDGTKLDGIGTGANVTSVNSQTGVVTLAADDISDTTSTHKFITSTEKTKLAGIESGAQVNTVTPTNTITFTNKRTSPRTNILTSGTTVNWQSADYDINFLGVGHNLTIAADSSGANAQTGEVREFIITANGTNTVTFDTTSTYGFKYSSDVTGYTVSDTSGKIDLVLAQYLLNNKWNIIAVSKGY